MLTVHIPKIHINSNNNIHILANKSNWMTKTSSLSPSCFSLLGTRALINQPFSWEWLVKTKSRRWSISTYSVWSLTPMADHTTRCSLSISTAIFPGTPGSAGTRMSPFCILLEWLRWWWQLQLHDVQSSSQIIITDKPTPGVHTRDCSQ